MGLFLLTYLPLNVLDTGCQFVTPVAMGTVLCHHHGAGGFDPEIEVVGGVRRSTSAAGVNLVRLVLPLKRIKYLNCFAKKESSSVFISRVTVTAHPVLLFAKDTWKRVISRHYYNNDTKPSHLGRLLID